MTRHIPPPCPLCGFPAPQRALLGVFPVWLCLTCDDGGPVVYGFWSDVAFFVARIMPDPTAGWAFFCYEGSYFAAIWGMVTGRVD